jgi:putative hydrolase
MPSKKTPPNLAFNKDVAKMFRRFAELMQGQDGNPFRINAYLRAAGTLESLDADVREMLRHGGIEKLIELPGIGRGLASSIDEIARTGKLSQLDRLEGTTTPEQLFQTIPGIGPGLSRTIHDSLDIDTLEALEVAAHDGSLEAVPGIGRRRSAAVSAALASILNRPRSRIQNFGPNPAVAMVLDVDREYRDKARRGMLRKIAPRRFNPDNQAWLPVLHTVRESWRFTALYSNTARAHELGRSTDWVVIYFYDDDHQEGQCTVVTETHGPMRGRRVVRGRESECLAWYSQADTKPPATQEAAR